MHFFQYPRKKFVTSPRARWRINMKTKFSFSKNHTSLLLAMVTLLFLSARSTTFADSATWTGRFSTDWNTNGNWSPNTGYPGTVSGADTATFNSSSFTTFLSISSSINIAAIDFTSSGPQGFEITVASPIQLTISGAGITNSSPVSQTFVTVGGNGAPGTILFTNSATAGSLTAFENDGGAVSGHGGGNTLFGSSSTAGSGNFINNGATVSGATGGVTGFDGTSTADSATLIANGGTVAGAGGGLILFTSSSLGGTASIDVRNDGAGTAGNLDISGHTGSVTIGSLEGSGNAFLGANNLTVGSNNLSKTFSGVMQNGGLGGGFGGGSLTKTGTGTLTLSGANTYTGGTNVNAGTLLVSNTSGSGTGSGAVQINAGTLGGTGTIAGAVTIGTGSGAGAFLSPGQSPGTLTIQSALTLNSDATYKFELNSSTTAADKVIANGVTIAGAQFSFTDLGNATLASGTGFVVIDDTALSPITGTFTNLADHSMFTIGNNTFLVNYEGGDGNNLTIEVIVPEPSTWLAAVFLSLLLVIRLASLPAARLTIQRLSTTRLNR